MFISKVLQSILKTWIQMPSWMRWAGGSCLAVGYSFLFYFFFVSPTGLDGVLFMVIQIILKVIRFMVLM